MTPVAFRDDYDHAIFPLVAWGSPGDRPDGLGTTFIADGVFFATWHQVRGAIEEGHDVGAAWQDPETGKHFFVPLNFERPSSHDVAVAELPDGVKDLGVLRLNHNLPGDGRDVFSYGYPLPELGERIGAEGVVSTLVVGRRLLRGYVVRGVADLSFSPHPAALGLEVDMQAPPGQSGAPLMAFGGDGKVSVIGMVQGGSVTTVGGESARFARVYGALILVNARQQRAVHGEANRPGRAPRPIDEPEPT